jgi:hypothetical protein
MAASPLWVKDKVAGVLYVDTGDGRTAWNPDGVALAATLVAMGLEVLPLRARQPRPLPPQPRPAEEESPPFIASHDSADPDADSIDSVELDEEIETAPEADAVETLTDDPAGPEPVDAPDLDLIGMGEDTIAVDAVMDPAAEYDASQPPMPAPPAQEDPRHDEARRFARLLVSEILLYNEKQVREGRLKKDLYERLREDIERSRQMYDERISMRLPDAATYFREELIRSIAEGDESAMKLPWG